MQSRASLFLPQVLHGSEDKGKMNLTRAVRPWILFLAHLAALSDDSFDSSLSSAPWIYLFVPWIYLYICFRCVTYAHRSFLSDCKESSSLAFSYYSSYRYKQKHLWDSVFWVRCFCYLFSFNHIPLLCGSYTILKVYRQFVIYFTNVHLPS